MARRGRSLEGKKDRCAEGLWLHRRASTGDETPRWGEIPAECKTKKKKTKGRANRDRRKTLLHSKNSGTKPSDPGSVIIPGKGWGSPALCGGT